MDHKEIGSRLRRLRGNQDAKSVAKALGISTSALFMYERGERSPRDQVKMKIARYYGLPVQEIFFLRMEHKKCSKTGKRWPPRERRTGCKSRRFGCISLRWSCRWQPSSFRCGKNEKQTRIQHRQEAIAWTQTHLFTHSPHRPQADEAAVPPGEAGKIPLDGDWYRHLRGRTGSEGLILVL